MNWKRQLALATSAVAIATATIAGPVTAATVPPEYGSAIKCKFKVTHYVDGLWSEAELRLIAVIPPVMYATEDGNMVGWGFVLRRSVDGRPYTRVVKSSLQRRIGSTTNSADFGVRRMRIQVPSAADPESVRYQVTLVMVHYNADGSIHSTTKYLMTYHIDTFDGIKYNQGLPYCEGTATQ